MEEQGSEGLSCINCQRAISAEAKFCNHCGSLQEYIDVDEAEKRERRLMLLSVFFGIHLLICLIARFVESAEGLTWFFFFDSVVSITTIGFAIYLRKDITPLFRFPDFSLLKLLGFIAAAIAGAVFVNIAVGWLNKNIFEDESNYYEIFRHYKYGKLYTILMIAVQPAIFEELAFRGVMQQGLRKIMDEKQAIFIAAFLFALLHLSFVSFFWLWPFAIALGYICSREKTLWYGTIIHFVFNTVACIFEFWELNVL